MQTTRGTKKVRRPMFRFRERITTVSTSRRRVTYAHVLHTRRAAKNNSEEKARVCFRAVWLKKNKFH